MASRAERAPDWQTGFDAGIEAATPEWRDIATAPRGKQIMLGKWCEDMWFWIASGSIEIDGMHWCDLIDASFEPFSHADPTHWREVDAPPTQKDTP